MTAIKVKIITLVIEEDTTDEELENLIEKALEKQVPAHTLILSISHATRDGEADDEVVDELLVTYKHKE